MSKDQRKNFHLDRKGESENRVREEGDRLAKAQRCRKDCGGGTHGRDALNGKGVEGVGAFVLTADRKSVSQWVPCCW